MTIGPDGKHTEFPVITTNDSGALGGKQAFSEVRDNQLRYKPATAFDSLKNLFNIRAIFSSIRAMLASFFGPSNAAKEIRNNFKVITEPKALDNAITETATELISGLRSQPTEPKALDNAITETATKLISSLRSQPADVSISEAQRLRADSALALFNMGFFSSIVENYADWQTEGTAKEGEVWQRAYDELLSNNAKDKDFDPAIGALLLSKVDARYSGSEKLEQKLYIGKALLTSNYNKALEALNEAIAGEPNPAKKTELEQARTRLETAFTSYTAYERDFSNYDDISNAWLQLNRAVEDIPFVHGIMVSGYTNPSDNLKLQGH